MNFIKHLIKFLAKPIFGLIQPARNNIRDKSQPLKPKPKPKPWPWPIPKPPPFPKPPGFKK